MPRVVVVASGDYYSQYGGGQVYVKNFVEALHSQIFDLCVFSIFFSDSEKEKIIREDVVDGVRIVSVEIGGDKGRCLKELDNYMLEIFKELLSKYRPEIIHAHGWKYGFTCVCNEMDIPIVITAHHGGIVCPKGALLNYREEICEIPAEASECLHCVIDWAPFHNSLSRILNVLPKAFATKIGVLAERLPFLLVITPMLTARKQVEYKLKCVEELQNSTATIIAPSNSIYKALHRNGLDGDRLTVVPHGIPETFGESISIKRRDQLCRIAYVGRINRVKGIDILLEAFSRGDFGRKAKLSLYGEAVTKQERRYHNKLIRKYTHNNIEWCGKVSQKDYKRVLAELDVLVLPTICVEVYGLVVAEALASGVPVISTRCGGPEDLVINGKNGLLVEVNSVDALQQALNVVISKPKILEEMRNRIIKDKRDYGMKKHINNIIKLYEQKLSAERYKQ